MGGVGRRGDEMRALRIRGGADSLRSSDSAAAWGVGPRSGVFGSYLPICGLVPYD